MIDIVTMLVNKFFRSCFLSDLFRAARADVLHVTRARPSPAQAGVNSLKCPHCYVSALTAQASPDHSDSNTSECE